MPDTIDGLLAALWWMQLSDEQKEEIRDTYDWSDDLGLWRGAAG